MTPDPDAQRRTEHRRMRRLASTLLVLMLLVFLAARLAQGTYDQAWLPYVEAFAEAAMVGAIADWFAVTALFRHPFGLPIPHTAIVPRNKDRMGRALGLFIASEFLTDETIRHKLGTIDVARHVGDWLAEPANARQVAARTAAAVPAVIDAMGEEHVRDFVSDGIVRGLHSVDLAPLLGRVLSVLVANRRHQALFDRLIELAWRFLEANHDAIRQKVAERGRWWMPKFVDDKLFRRIVDGIEGTLYELRDPAHPWREQFNLAVEDYVRRLAAGDVHRERGEAIKQEILGNPLVGRYIDTVWSDIRERVRADAEDPDGTMHAAVARVLLAIGHRLQEDAEMRAVVNSWVERLALANVAAHRDKIAAFMTGVVQRWDIGTVVAKVELLVGKDLQYIRINGTIVGGTVGLVIHALTAVAG